MVAAKYNFKFSNFDRDGRRYSDTLSLVWFVGLSA